MMHDRTKRRSTTHDQVRHRATPRRPMTTTPQPTNRPITIRRPTRLPIAILTPTKALMVTADAQFQSALLRGDARSKCSLFAVAGVLALAACATDPSISSEPPVPDRAIFDTAIYPLLLRDCGFSECHGAEHRFFQVFGPGRAHLEGHVSDPDLGPRERQLSYDRARSMLVPSGGGSIQQSPLLAKPLELGAGGASHRGVDHYGRNVFQTVNDPRYVALWQWALNRAPQAPPAVTPPQTQPVQPSAAGAPNLATGGSGTVNGSQPAERTAGALP
jgi:hypothetical protein